MAKTCHVYYSLLIISGLNAHAQTISTTTPLPPLQWLNLSGLLSGPTPPPLKDSSIAYDEVSRSLLVFGGESEGGFVQSQTYLLNLDTLTWSIPSPPTTLDSSPSARSGALGGIDFAASNRHGFVVIGGKGSNGQALSDVWEYDFNNQFWSQVALSPGGPSARWGASGGIDFRTAAVQDSVVPGPNNTFYLAGGLNGRNPRPLSDIWKLELSGTLSSNMPNTATGRWVNISFSSPDLSSRVGQASTMQHQQIVVVGGCNTSSVSSDSCARQDSHIINTESKTQISPGPCPAPRLSATLVPNLNSFSSSFSSQVFLLLGTFNTSLWEDNGGLEKGEVAVLDINAGSWTRVLPSGDPGMDGKPTVPTAREGAAAFAFTSALVGQSRQAASDTIVFGGRDAFGKYLSEVWLLRAYNGTITQSRESWSGFGDGQLQTGINANGAGVTLQYMSKCASAINPSLSTPSSNATRPTPSGHTSPTTVTFDTALSHKVLAPLSIALLLPPVFVFRLASPPLHLGHPTERHTILVYISAFIAYGAGVAGITTSFTTIVSKSSSSSGVTLKTVHGRAGLALFSGLYAFIPIILILSVCLRRSSDVVDHSSEKSTITSRPRINSGDTTEIRSSHLGHAKSAPQSIRTPSRPSSPLPRAHSWGPVGAWYRSYERRISSDSESVLTTPATQGFEVLNRPIRTQTRSAGMAWPTPESQHLSPIHIPPASLRDVEWLRRRRSLNAVGELDYAITLARRTQGPPTPLTADPLIIPVATSSQPVMPHVFEALLRMLFHSLLVAFCIFSLVAIWSRASRIFFAIFLAWTCCFYISIFVFAWHGKPQKSITAVIITRLRTPLASALNPGSQPSPTPGTNEVPFPTESRGPYVHQPPYRAAFSLGQDDVLLEEPRSVETDGDDEDEDEDSRQRRIEDEMARREVSIVTVPKRKLWIANPS